MKTCFVLMKNDFPYAVYQRSETAIQSLEVLNRIETALRLKAKKDRVFRKSIFYHLEEVKYDQSKPNL